MPATNNDFPWKPYYDYKSFLRTMTNHSKVSAINEIGSGRFDIKLNDGRTLKTFICECYSFGLAEYYETIENLGELDIIMVDSEWCHYSMEAKKHCWQNGVGLFKLKELMAALHKDDYWLYLRKNETNEFKRLGWI